MRRRVRAEGVSGDLVDFVRASWSVSFLEFAAAMSNRRRTAAARLVKLSRMLFRALSAAALAAAFSATAASAGAKSHTTPASLDRRLAATLRIPGVISHSSTAVVRGAPVGSVVFAHNAGVSLEPASNEKLSVTFAALNDLGAGYRYPTSVLGEGRRVGSTWEGRLVLKGSGDPSLTSGGLRRLANILWRRESAGSRAISSGTRRSSTPTGSRPDGFRRLPGTSRRPSRASSSTGRHETSASSRTRRSRLRRTFDRLLRARGIAARSAVTGKADPGSPTLATIYSDPLSQIIEFMDHYSDNFTAEMLLKTLGAHASGLGTTSAGAADVRRDLVAAGIPVAGVRIVDGSGLSRDDRVTGQELSSILVHMWNNPAMRRSCGPPCPSPARSARSSTGSRTTPIAPSCAGRRERPTSPRRCRDISARATRS